MRFPVNSISTRSAARTSECILVFVFGLAGAAITAISVNCGGAPPVFASAITGLCAACLGMLFRLPGCASLAAFSGTFAGMGLVHVNSHKFAWVLMMSVVVAGVLLALHDLQQRHPKLGLSGVGGRLGCFAFAGFALFSVVALRRFPALPLQSLEIQKIMWTFFGMVLGATMTAEFRRSLPADTADHNVMASAIVGLVGSVFLICDAIFGQTLALGIYAGSFVGMSTLAVVRPKFILTSCAIASIVLGAANLFLQGWGGLLGSAAACGVVLAQHLQGEAGRDGRVLEETHRRMRSAEADDRPG